MIKPIRVALMAMLAFGVAACGRGDRDATTSEGGAVVTESAVRVADVELGRGVGADNRIADETDDFRPNDTIYASVRTTGSGTATITARWTYQDGQVVDSTSRSIQPTGEAHTQFNITRPGGWPTGNYRLEVLVNGQVAETEEFEVKQ